MYFATVRFGEPIPIYNGKGYPCWKDKMMKNIIAINSAAWEVVKHGVQVKDEKALTLDEMKSLALDSKV